MSLLEFPVHWKELKTYTPGFTKVSVLFPENKKFPENIVSVEFEVKVVFPVIFVVGGEEKVLGAGIVGKAGTTGL